MHRVEVPDGDRSDTARPSVLGGRTALRELLEQSREIEQILTGLAWRIAVEAAQAFGDVGRVTDLAHLAIADYVDADVDLAPHDVADGSRDRPRCGDRIGDFIALARKDHV